MDMKSKIIAYIETQNISKVQMAQELHMDLDKFEQGNTLDWTAEELLKICVYIQANPEQFYDRKLY